MEAIGDLVQGDLTDRDVSLKAAAAEQHAHELLDEEGVALGLRDDDIAKRVGIRVALCQGVRQLSCRLLR